MQERNIKVFVYGTLRKGQGNNYLLKEADFIGEAKTKDKYAMYASGIPYVVEDKPVSRITGEIFSVNQEELMRLDRLEGHPQWYRRRVIPVTTEDGAIHHSWIYFNPHYMGKLVESGDYCKI
jgi:gamma-glutamylcyclotransferase (GGCT)/AIG2-like uncharacterized protein YtfP